jgi:hypothetical protein
VMALGRTRRSGSAHAIFVNGMKLMRPDLARIEAAILLAEPPRGRCQPERRIDAATAGELSPSIS